MKRITETDLENNHSPALYAWIAEFTRRIPQVGFRLPMPLCTRDGCYITPDGWTAASFLPGRFAAAEDIPDCIQAVASLHRAIAGVPKNPLLDDNRTPWGYAHRGCWGEPPEVPQPQLRPLVAALYGLRRPIPTSPWQVIHGDLNLDNILIEPGLPPAILDFSPYWAPPEFALAILAHFSGPRRKDPGLLRHFEHIPHFDQLLVRAMIRMLLIVSGLNGLDDWENAPEKWAAEYTIEHLLGSAK